MKCEVKSFFSEPLFDIKKKMNALEALQKRRTFRNYDPNWTCPKDVLEQIVNTALDSPSGCNYQGIDLVVITNRDKLNAIEKTVLGGWSEEQQKGWDSRHEEYGVKNVLTCDAGVLFLLVKNANAKDDFLQIDAGIMTQTIMTAAMNFGLGSMCIGAMLWGDKSRVEAEVGIPKGSLVMAVAIGKVLPNPKLNEKVRTCKVTYIE